MAVEINEDYNLCVNPYPILPEHVTLPYQEHIPQRIGDNFILDIDYLLNEMPEDYAIFYNGPCCGASAPDHFHFQGVLKKDVPLIAQYQRLRIGSQVLKYNSKLEEKKDFGTFCYYEESFRYIDKYTCTLFAFESNHPQLTFDLKEEIKPFAKATNENEPKFNIFAWRENDRLIVLLIPRSKHRPDCFFAESEAQLLVSPGALDMAGIMVTARPEDFERMKFNTAIAAMMAFVNDVYTNGKVTRGELKALMLCLNPVAPHITEEIWESIGGEGFVSAAEWPKWDDAKTVDATVEYAVQVLGKLRGTVIVNADDDKETVLAKAKAVDKVAPFLEGKQIVKEIFVPNKLVNFVVR